MAVKKKFPRNHEAVGGITPPETPSEAEMDRRAERADRVSKKKKDTVSEKRLEHIIKNPLVEVELTEQKIPLTDDAISATVHDGLMDYQIAGTHLRLLGMVDPTKTPDLEQRVAMAKRLNQVGKFLPQYVKIVRLKAGKGISETEAAESAEQSEHDQAQREKTDAVNAGEASTPETRRASRRVKKQQLKEAPKEPAVSRTPVVKEMTRASAIVGGIPLKKICSEVDIDPKDARMILRKQKVDKPGGRWEWTKEKAEEVKAILVKGKADL